ncbi:MAG: hypothetical protein HMLKMBBP_00116 [Planctomycetes bacterium]|nr:hypothetical protein [Planctomycetota bacterium]
MAEDPRLRKIARLIEELESEDAFARRDAIEALHKATKRRMGFPWRGGERERAAAVKRWREWFDGVRREKEAAELQATLQHLGQMQGPPTPAQTKLVEAALESALKKMQDAPGKGVHVLLGGQGATGAPLPAHILAAMQKLAAAHEHPVCISCGRRPATVACTIPAKQGPWVRRDLCEICAQQES